MKLLLSRKMQIYVCILAMCISVNAFAEFKVSALPTTENPKKLVLENDSLKMVINFDRQLTVPILEYKSQGINLIPDGKAIHWFKLIIPLF